MMVFQMPFLYKVEKKSVYIIFSPSVLCQRWHVNCNYFSQAVIHTHLLPNVNLYSLVFSFEILDEFQIMLCSTNVPNLE